MRSIRNINDFYIGKKQMVTLIAISFNRQLLIMLISKWQMQRKMVYKTNIMVLLVTLSLTKDTFFYLHLWVEFTIIIYSYGIMNCDCDKSSTTWCSHYVWLSMYEKVLILYFAYVLSSHVRMYKAYLTVERFLWFFLLKIAIKLLYL